jgi:ERCC4-type nuclease
MSEPLIIYCDTRENRVPPFPDGCVVERVSMGEADYTSPALQGIAVVERKSAADFASSLTRDRERFEDEIRRLRAYRWKAIVVEADLSYVYRITETHPNAILGSIASFFARHDLPTFFAINEHGTGRLIAGLLKRWEERLRTEREEVPA